MKYESSIEKLANRCALMELIVLYFMEVGLLQLVYESFKKSEQENAAVGCVIILFVGIMLITHFIISLDLFKNRNFLYYVLSSVVTVGLCCLFLWVLIIISGNAFIVWIALLLWWAVSHTMLREIRSEELFTKYLRGGGR